MAQLEYWSDVANTPKAAIPKFEYDPSESCAVQMIGHQATNLLLSIDLYNVTNDVGFPREKKIVEEAVKNLRERVSRGWNY